MKCANEQFFSQSSLDARKGILVPKRVDLGVGQKIYRFYDSRKAPMPKSGANGAWWLEYEYFQKIKQFSLQHNHSFSYAVRLFAAILYEWSEVDSYVRCEVLKPLGALKGRGKQVASTGRDPRDLPTMTPMQSLLEIYQLYVPGIGGPGSISGSVLRVVESHKL